MGLDFGVNWGGLFQSSYEDGQFGKSYGDREIPSDDDDTISTKKPDEYIVDAAGNGDYTTIAAALTALGASSGTIRVLAGNYLITANISLGANQTIFGSGYGTNITTTSDITLITLSGNRSSIFMCRIDGNNTGSSQQGISVNGDECIIRNCWVTQMGDIGIYGSSSDRLIIDGCVVEDCTDHCVYLNDTDFSMISDCVIDNSADTGMELVSALGVSIVGCKIMNHGEHGLYITGSFECLISGNYIFSNGDNNNNGDGIYLSSENNCCIVGNSINTNDGVGVDIAATCNDIVLVGNVLLNNEDGSHTDAGTDSIIANNAVP